MQGGNKYPASREGKYEQGIKQIQGKAENPLRWKEQHGKTQRSERSEDLREQQH